MRITYIHHSGFLVETGRLSLLFDYIGGPLPELDSGKALLVFASHRHPDHFVPAIFDLTEKYPQAHFILSDDIPARSVPHQFAGQTDFIAEHAVLHLPQGGGTIIRTYHSTDEGVAFVVENGGHTIYHAGDLNDWRWNGEADDWNSSMHRDYLAELKRIHDDGIHPDAAMVPLDGRLEEWFYLGLDEFMKTVGAGMVLPMHFWGDFDITSRLLALPCSEQYRSKVAVIQREGQSFGSPES